MSTLTDDPIIADDAAPSWWRRNRRSLLVLPIVVVVALAASSSRIVLFWLPSGPHDITRAGVGEPVAYSQPWQDRDGHHLREVSVSVDDVRPAPTRSVDVDGESREVVVTRTEDRESASGEVLVTSPPGTTVWQVALTFEADPQQALRVCTVAIVDTLGRTVTTDSTSNIVESVEGYFMGRPCVPDDRPGPSANLVEGLEDDPAEMGRPPSWTTHAYLVLADDAVPETVSVWFDLPEVVEVTLPR